MELRRPQHLELKRAWGGPGGHGNLLDVHQFASVAFGNSFIQRIFFRGLPVRQALFQAFGIQSIKNQKG